jgi:hypothetical protein
LPMAECSRKEVLRAMAFTWMIPASKGSVERSDLSRT